MRKLLLFLCSFGPRSMRGESGGMSSDGEGGNEAQEHSPSGQSAKNRSQGEGSLINDIRTEGYMG